MNTKQIILQRKEQAESMSLDEKAAHFRKRLFDEFQQKPYFLISDKISTTGQSCAHLDHTTHLLAILAWEYAISQDPELEGTAKKTINSLRTFDRANGLEGCLPKTGTVNGKGIEIIDNNARSNTYSHLLFSYILAHQTFQDPELKSAVAEHIASIAKHVTECDFALKSPKGKEIKHSNMSPTRFFYNPSKYLDGLLIIESGLNTIDPQEQPQLIRELKSKKHEILNKYHGKRRIQKLHFRIPGTRIEYPTISSSWLNFLKLHALSSLTGDAHYETAMQGLYSSQQEEQNPFFDLMYLDSTNNSNPEFRSKLIRRCEEILNTFPLDLTNIGELPVDPRLLKRKSRRFKLKSRPEVREPLPVYARNQTPYEWKENAFRARPNKDYKPGEIYNGTDFLMVYTLLKKIEAEK